MATTDTSRSPFWRATRIMPSSRAPGKTPGFNVRIEKRMASCSGLLVQSRRNLHDHLAPLRVDREDHVREIRQEDLPLPAPDHDHVVAPGREDVGHGAQMRPLPGADAKPHQLEAVVRAL